MDKRKACLIINPRSGQNVIHLADILAVLNAAEYKTTVALKEYGGHSIEMAQQAAKDHFDLIIAYGGDGTLNQVVNGVMNTKGSQSTVAGISGGTVNLWANEIGMPTGNPAKAALALLDSEIRHVDVGHVMIEDISPLAQKEQMQDGQTIKKKGRNDKKKIKNAPRSHFLLMAGLGIDAVVMQGVSKPLKHKIKQLAVGLSVAKELPSYHPFPIEVCKSNGELLWKGDALQVVIGNTRLYADILRITPDAYIDDGQLDVCVITAGNPLGTVQQVFSLLLRHQPDELTAAYFRDKQLSLRVPASIRLQLDGSSVDLKDYLTRAQKQALKAGEDPKKMMVQYRFEALPQKLPIAIPHNYDNTLFEEEGEKQPSTASEEVTDPTSHSDPLPTQSVEADLSQTSQSQPDTHAEKTAGGELVAKLRETGRKVSLVGGGHDRQNDTYILAGSVIQTDTGAKKPMAVTIDKQATILNSKGELLTLTALYKIKEGHELLVTGKKNKWGVIKAEQIMV